MLAHLGVPTDRQPPALLEDLARVLTRVYVATLVEHLTLPELRVLVRFYDTPEGRNVAPQDGVVHCRSPPRARGRARRLGSAPGETARRSERHRELASPLRRPPTARRRVVGGAEEPRRFGRERTQASELTRREIGVQAVRLSAEAPALKLARGQDARAELVTGLMAEGITKDQIRLMGREVPGKLLMG
jgi:hypothetical protein